MRLMAFIVIAGLLCPDVQAAMAGSVPALFSGSETAVCQVEAFSPRALQVVTVLENHGPKPALNRDIDTCDDRLGMDQWPIWSKAAIVLAIVLWIDIRLVPMALTAAAILATMPASNKFRSKKTPYRVWHETWGIGRVVHTTALGVAVCFEEGRNLLIRYETALKSLDIMDEDETASEPIDDPAPVPAPAVKKVVRLPSATRKVIAIPEFKRMKPVPLKDEEAEELLDHLVDVSPGMAQERVGRRDLSVRQQRSLLDAEIDLMNFLNAPWVRFDLLESYGLSQSWAHRFFYAREEVRRGGGRLVNGAHVHTALMKYEGTISRAKLKEQWRLLVAVYRAGMLGLRKPAPKKKPTSPLHAVPAKVVAPSKVVTPAPRRRRGPKKTRATVVEAFLETLPKEMAIARPDIERYFVPIVLSVGLTDFRDDPKILERFFELAAVGFALPWTTAVPFPQGAVVYGGGNYGVVQWPDQKPIAHARVIPILSPEGEVRQVIRDVLTPVVINKAYVPGTFKRIMASSHVGISGMRLGAVLASLIVAAHLSFFPSPTANKRTLAQAL